MERYNRFSKYLRSRFREKVLKLTLDLGLGCPNRDGTLSSEGCIYCDEFGSGAGSGAIPIDEQIKTRMELLKRKRGVNKFIGYFQSYTNTYCSPEFLEEKLSVLLNYPEIVLVYLGTRPDTFTRDHLEVIKRFKKKKDIGIEFGLQSARNETLKKINRQHKFKNFENAVKLTVSEGIFTTAHIIIGLPGEDISDNIYTAQELSRLKVHSVKIHQLYIVKGTQLEKLFLSREFSPISFDLAVESTVSVLLNLDKSIIIQRLTGDPKPGQLVSPDWIRDKHRFINMIDKIMNEKGFTQGQELGETF